MNLIGSLLIVDMNRKGVRKRIQGFKRSQTEVQGRTMELQLPEAGSKGLGESLPVSLIETVPESPQDSTHVPGLTEMCHPNFTPPSCP